MSAVIFHIDMDAFFASIEILRNPKLKGKAVVVGGNPNSRGVVSTCSYEARKFGVHSAMSLHEAKKRCPHAIFIQGSYSLYGTYSARVMKILRQLTWRVEVVSIDEAYLDVTDKVSKYGSALALAKKLKEVVQERTQLPCSIGIGSNKLLAKIASSLAKPNGIYEIAPGEEERILAPLGVGAIPGIGKKTEAFLHSKGIITIGDLQKFSVSELVERFGSSGYYYFLASHGKYSSPVQTEPSIPKSFGAETTFPADTNDKSFLKQTVVRLTERAWEALKEHKMYTGAVCLKLRTAAFETRTHSRQLIADTNDLAFLQEELAALFETRYIDTTPLRLVGVSLHKLQHEYWQPSLLDRFFTLFPKSL